MSKFYIKHVKSKRVASRQVITIANLREKITQLLDILGFKMNIKTGQNFVCFKEEMTQEEMHGELGIQRTDCVRENIYLPPMESINLHKYQGSMLLSPEIVFLTFSLIIYLYIEDSCKH